MLTHLDSQGRAHMVDVTDKAVTFREAAAQAVVRNATNEPIVWIKSGAERFIAQPVRLQALDASTVVITQGLGADNRVVVQGAALIAQIR